MRLAESNPIKKMIIAAAGSGKTTYLVNEALSFRDRTVLITTFTESNEDEIRSRLIAINRCIPANITVQTWWSFLLRHGVRPYQGYLRDNEINGVNLVNGVSASYSKETDIDKHYFDQASRIYSDKISKFLLKCNEVSEGRVISRLEQIFNFIYVDEVQDLAAHDLEFLKLLLKSKIGVLLVGDPRQGIFSTSNSAKNKKYQKSKVIDFFEDKCFGQLEIDRESLKVSHRSIKAICDLSNRLYPGYAPTIAGNDRVTGHDGIFLVRPKDVPEYLQQFPSMQLRDRKNVVVCDGPVINFGAAKGLAFDRVLIYPTQPIIDWLKDDKTGLADTSRSKLYVAITRARQSVAFVYNFNDDEEIPGVLKYIPQSPIISVAS